MKKTLLILFILFIAVPAFAWQMPTQNQPYVYKFSSGTTVTTVKTGSGIFHTLTVTGGTTSPIQIYDGQGTALDQVIASFTTTNAIATYMFDIGFSSGCTVVAGPGLKYTVSYL